LILVPLHRHQLRGRKNNAHAREHFRGAHASGVLVSAFRRNSLPFGTNIG
jgi:hypothetical protein